MREISLFAFPCVHSPTNFDWSSLSLPRNEIFKSSRTNDNELCSFETERIGIPSLPVSGLSRDDVEPMRRTIRYSRLFCFILPCHRPSTVLQASRLAARQPKEVREVTQLRVSSFASRGNYHNSLSVWGKNDVDEGVMPRASGISLPPSKS